MWNLCIPREVFLFFEFGKVFVALILFHSLLEILEISYRKFWSKSLAPKKSFLLSYCRWWRHFKWVAEGLWNRKETKSQENLYCRTGNSCYFETLNSHNSHSMTCVRIKKEKQYFELVMEAFRAGENKLWCELSSLSRRFLPIIRRVCRIFLMEKLRFFEVRGFWRWYFRVIQGQVSYTFCFP